MTRLAPSAIDCVCFKTSSIAPLHSLHSQPVLSPCQCNPCQSGKDLLHAASMGADGVCKGFDSDGLALVLVLVSLGSRWGLGLMFMIS